MVSDFVDISWTKRLNFIWVTWWIYTINSKPYARLYPQNGDHRSYDVISPYV